MQKDLDFHARWVLLSGLLFAGCGGSEDATPRAVSAPRIMVTAPQTASGSNRPGTEGMPLTGRQSPSPSKVDDAADPPIDPVKLAQLGALPHLSALSPREKAGLLLMLPSQSPSERLVLIDMYPSLVQLPIQQKQVLLDKLEKIVPVKVSERR